MKILYLSLLFCILNVRAAEFQLAWTNSPTIGVTNYVLYASTNVLNNANKTNATVKLNVGTNLNGYVSNIQPYTWSFGATAMKDGVESDLGNILIIDVPRPPVNMKVVVVQFSGTLSNFYDVGFFRLKLE